MTTPQLRAEYPELADWDFVTVEIVDNGEVLGSIPDGELDFVIANHFLEHCEDPIQTLWNHLRVLRKGGFIYMAVPDRRYTFDRQRKATSLEHLVRDNTDGPGWSRRGHYEEWARFVERVPEPVVSCRAADLDEVGLSIHFHVWTSPELAELLEHCRADLGLAMSLETLRGNGHETLVVLRKT
jgi:SAM-dependent methyltransferase